MNTQTEKEVKVEETKSQSCSHIIAFDFDYGEVCPSMAVRDDDVTLVERVYCSFCPNCGKKLREPDAEGRIYGLKGFDFLFEPPSPDDKRRFDVRLFRFCINTGQFNGEVDEIYF